ncbi:GNAT family N-acetyltransferase [Cohnella suwonensis]|uniref:GNAT family N-acetyltransferase n=1 Tax=Cohnella suwonensis TaxID=696072 RepID=A0ABW0LZB6_9BACL
MSAVPPILIDFPDRFESDRLFIRLPLPGDGAEVNAAMQESLAELRPWLLWANRDQNVSDTEQIIRQSHAKFIERTDLRFHGYDKRSGELAICCGLHRIDWHVRVFEIGYWVRTKFAGNGFATEAAGSLERLAIEHLGANRIEIRCDRGNVRSANVALRLGYVLEGTLRGNQLSSDSSRLTDTSVYAKVRGIEF